MAEVRMPITWAKPLVPVSMLIGARHDSWIAVGERDVEARMGPLARIRFPRSLIKEVRRLEWPWYFGFGIRIAGRRSVGLVGDRRVVQVLLSHPVLVRAVVPFWMDRLAVSVAEPDRLMRSMQPPGEPAAPRPRSRGRVRPRRAAANPVKRVPVRTRSTTHRATRTAV
jgi:hypothetical protein